MVMISVGIDVSKNESTVCIMKPGGEILKTPFKIEHSMKEMPEENPASVRNNWQKSENDEVAGSPLPLWQRNTAYPDRPCLPI